MYATSCLVPMGRYVNTTNFYISPIVLVNEQPWYGDMPVTLKK